MILVDTIYIHSYGGKVLLEYFIESITERNFLKEFMFFFDERLEFEKNFVLPKHVTVKPSHFSRKKAYQNLKTNVDTILCLANVPPPIKLEKKVYIYFHNLLLLKKTGFNSLLRYYYLRFFNNSDYIWIVQTEYLKNMLSKSLKIKHYDILKIPFFKTMDIKISKKDFNDKNLNFICVTSNLEHKNVNNLITAFMNVKSKKNIKLFITMDGSNLTKDGIEIIFTGVINRIKLLDLYSKAHFLIFPSTHESLGLPIIEAIKSGSKVIVSKIPTFKEICKTEYFFNPHNNNEMKASIEKACSDKNESMPSLLIDDRVSDLINKLVENV